MQQKFVCSFQEGNGSMRRLLGGKGADLAEMTGLHLPVPEGFTVTAEACLRYHAQGRVLSDVCLEEIFSAIKRIEAETGRRFGGSRRPLLLAVRCGAGVSMPGLMETVLNLGMNEDVVRALAAESGDPRWAWDCYVRFIRSYACAVRGGRDRHFETLLESVKLKRGVSLDEALTMEDLQLLAKKYLAAGESRTGEAFPTDPVRQLTEAVAAAMESWYSPRACVFRRDHHMPDDCCLAVNVQRMVFGNLGGDSGVGVAFPGEDVTGPGALSGEFLPCAQGNDLSAGLRLPLQLSQLEDRFPAAYERLEQAVAALRTRAQDLRDVRFVLEHGALFLLRSHSEQRSARQTIMLAFEQGGDAAAQGVSGPGEQTSLPQNGFDPSLSYAAYPTLSEIPADFLAALGQLKADWAEGKNEYA